MSLDQRHSKHCHQSLTSADLDSLDDCSSQDVNACHGAIKPATQTVRRVVKLVMLLSDVICCLVILRLTAILITGEGQILLAHLERMWGRFEGRASSGVTSGRFRPVCVQPCNAGEGHRRSTVLLM